MVNDALRTATKRRGAQKEGRFKMAAKASEGEK